MSERRFISVQCVWGNSRNVTSLRFAAGEAFPAIPSESHAHQYEHGGQREGELRTQNPSCQSIEPAGGVRLRFIRVFYAPPDALLKAWRQRWGGAGFAQERAKPGVIRFSIV